MAEDTSERKRISIPKADESVLAWWDAQKDPAQSVRLLIRAEIERNGYTDTAFRPVAQMPRRGRPPGSVDTGDDSADTDTAEAVSPVVVSVPAPAPVAAPVVAPVPVAAAVEPEAAPPVPVQPPAPAPSPVATPVPVAAPVVAPVAVAPALVEAPASGPSALDAIMNG